MNKRNRLAKGDKIKIIDRSSIDVGKTGTVIEIIGLPTEILNKPTGSKVEYYCRVKLEGTETTAEFALSQLRKYDRC